MERYHNKQGDVEMGKNKLLVTLDNQKLCIIRSKDREHIVCVKDGRPSSITEELDKYVNLWYHLFPNV